MKMVYIVQEQSTVIKGNIIHWADSAYIDEQEAIKQCNAMNRSIKNDPNYLAYVIGPIPLKENDYEIHKA